MNADKFSFISQMQLQAQLKKTPEFQRDIDRLRNQQINFSVGGTRAFRDADSEIRRLDKTVRRVRGGLEELGNVVGTAARRFGGISVATGTFLGLARGIKNSVGEAITFEREMIKVAQATDTAVSSTETLRKNIMQVADSYGASGVELAKYSRILAQAGFSVKQTQAAIKLLAKADLTGTFGGISENVEGMVAIMQQFGKEAAKNGKEIEFLQKAYDSISRVSKKYAIESGDIIEAVKKAGGVFATAGGSIEEFIAIMTSVRATTRESADVIANGLKTIATRLQDKNNIKSLQALGIELEDSKGNFVGVFEAVQRLSAGLKNLDPKSIRFANIVKELGGIYQIGRFITLIKEAKLSQEALNEAKNASGDIDKDVAKQQKSLGFQIDQLRQKFNNLVLEFTKSSTFKEFAGYFVSISDALLSVGESIKKNLPLFKTFLLLISGRAAMFAFKSWAGMSQPLTRTIPGGGNAVASEGWGNARAFKSGGHVKSNRGSQKTDRDSLNAILQPGEYVLRKKAVNEMGVNTLNMMNQGLFKTVDIASRRKAMFTNKGKGPIAYTGTVAQVLRKTKLKSLEGLYDLVNPEDSFYAPFINRLPLRDSRGNKVRLQDIKMQASQLMNQTMDIYGSGGPKAANAFISSTLGGFADKVSRKTFSDSGNAFKFITSIQGAIAEQIFRAANPSYQKLPNAYGMDMVSTDGKFAEIKATSTRMSPYTMIGKALIAMAKLNNPKTGFKNNKKDVIGIPETTFFDTALRFNTGGTVPGSGRGDKVPALLEPGEVVVNRRAARNVGYDVLHAMNRGSVSMLANGGEAGGKKRYRKDWDKTPQELVSIIQNPASANKDVIRAERILLLKIAEAANDWTKVGVLFEKIIGRIPKAQSISQTALTSEFKSAMGNDIGGEAGPAYAEMTSKRRVLKEESIAKDIQKLGIGSTQSVAQVAQLQVQAQTVQAVQEVAKAVENSGNKTVEAVSKVVETTKATTEAVKASPKNTLGPNAPKLGILGEAEKQVKEIDKAQSEQERAAEIKASQSSSTHVKPDPANTPKYQALAPISKEIEDILKKIKDEGRKPTKQEKSKIKELDKLYEKVGNEFDEKVQLPTDVVARTQALKETAIEQESRATEPTKTSDRDEFGVQKVTLESREATLARIKANREKEKADADAKAQPKPNRDTDLYRASEYDRLADEQEKMKGGGDGGRIDNYRYLSAKLRAKHGVQTQADESLLAKWKSRDEELNKELASQSETTPVKTGSATPLTTTPLTAKTKSEAQKATKKQPKTTGGGGGKKPPVQPPVATGGMPPEDEGSIEAARAKAAKETEIEIAKRNNQEPVKPVEPTLMEKLSKFSPALKSPKYSTPKSEEVFTSTLDRELAKLQDAPAMSFSRGTGKIISSQAEADKLLQDIMKNIPAGTDIGMGTVSTQLLTQKDIKRTLAPQIAETEKLIKEQKTKVAAQKSGSTEQAVAISELKKLEGILATLQKAPMARGYVAKNKFGSTIGLRAGAATKSTLMHEVGHGVDYSLGGGKSAASTQRGTFQNVIAEKLKPILEEYLVSQGKSAEEIKYRLKNEEIIADLFANGTDEVRAYLAATTDAKVGMEGLAKLVEEAERNSNGIVAGLGGLTSKQLRGETAIVPAYNPTQVKETVADKARAGEKSMKESKAAQESFMKTNAYSTPKAAALGKRLQKKQTDALFAPGSAISQQGLIGGFSGVMSQKEIEESKARVTTKSRKDAAKAQVKNIKAQKAKDMMNSGMSQQDVNAWFGSEEGKKFIYEEQKKAKAESRGSLQGTAATSSLNAVEAANLPKQSSVLKNFSNKFSQGISTIKNAPASVAGGIGRSLLQKFYPSMAYGRDEIGRIKRPGLMPIPGVGDGGGANPPNKPPVGGAGASGAAGSGGAGGNGLNNLEKSADKAGKKLFDLSNSSTSLFLGMSLLLSSFGELSSTITNVTGLNRDQTDAIQNAITSATAFYLTMQQASAIIGTQKIDTQGNLLDLEGNPTGKKAGKFRMRAEKLTGRVGGIGGLLTTLAIGGAIGGGIGGYTKQLREAEAGKKEKKISDELSRLEVGGTANLEALQKQAREAAGLRGRGGRGLIGGTIGGVIGGALGGAAVGGSAAAPTVVGIPLGMVAGAIGGGIAGGVAGQQIGEKTYTQTTSEEKSINASISAQYAAAKSAYNFSKSMDAVRSGNLTTQAENNILIKTSEDLAKAMSQTRMGVLTTTAELEATKFVNKNRYFDKDLTPFEQRQSAAVEAEAKIKEQAKGAKSSIRDNISKTISESFARATTAEELQKAASSPELEKLLNALQFAAQNASDEVDAGKRALEGEKARKDELDAIERLKNARDTEISKIQSAISIRTAELAIIQKVNAAMQLTAESSFRLQEAQQAISVITGQSLGGYNTDRLKDLSNVGTNKQAFQDTARILGKLLPNGQDLADQAIVAASAAEQFRTKAPTSGLLNGINDLRKQFAPGQKVDVERTKETIKAELNKIAPDFGKLNADIQSKIVEELYGTLTEGKIDFGVLTDISKTIADSGQKFADTLISAGEVANNYIEQMQNITATVIAENNKLTELKTGTVDIRSRAMERMASVSTLGNVGQKQLEANREAFRVARDRQILGGAGLNIAGGTAQYGAELKGINAQITTNRQKLSRGGLDVATRDLLGADTMKLENQAQALTTVLTRLTDQSDKASDKMAEISRLQAQKEFVKGRVESFAFGTMEERMGMAETNRAMQQVMATGNFQMIPDELKGSVRDLMKQVSELDPEGRVAQMYKGIQVNAIRQQQAMGFIDKKGAEQAIAAVQNQDLAQEKKLKAELNKIAQDELVAQQALIDAQAQLTQTYKDTSDKLRAGFLPNQQGVAIAPPMNGVPQAPQAPQVTAEVQAAPKKAKTISLTPTKKSIPEGQNLGTTTSQFKPDANIINQSFSRSAGPTIYGLEEAKNVAEQFKATLGENASLIKDTKMVEGVSKASYYGEFRPGTNTVGINQNPIKASVVNHELGHATDLSLGKNKQYASHTQGTFQNAIVEQIKPILAEQLKAKGMPEEYTKYRTTNTEIFADLMANTTPEARKILTSTTDAKAGMDALRNYESKLGTNIPGFAGIPISQQKLDVAPSMQAPSMSFEPIIQGMKTFTDKLAEVSQAFSNISMTHTLNVDGQINIGGVDISSIATQLRNSLGEYIGQAIEEEFNKRASTFRTA